MLITQVSIVLSQDSKVTTVPDYRFQYKNIFFTKVDLSFTQTHVASSFFPHSLFQADFNKLVANTSVSKIWGTGAVTKTGYYLNNISNVLRIILLVNFGGIYFDSDVISVKSLPHEEQEKIDVCWSLFKLQEKHK